MLGKLHAGLDRDGVVKLFYLDEARGRMLPVKHVLWIAISRELGLKPGEMARMLLIKDVANDDPHTG